MKTKRPDGQRLFSFQRCRPKRSLPDWPPMELRLPDSIEAIERGRPEPTAERDQSKTARLARLLEIPGVQRASRRRPPMPPGPKKSTRPRNIQGLSIKAAAGLQSPSPLPAAPCGTVLQAPEGEQ